MHHGARLFGGYGTTVQAYKPPLCFVSPTRNLLICYFDLRGEDQVGMIDLANGHTPSSLESWQWTIPTGILFGEPDLYGYPV